MRQVFGGLANVNIELTSRCNKGDGAPESGCWFCGRRKLERDFPHLAIWEDMPFKMLPIIESQLPPGIVIQFHDNGESLLYPRFGEAVSLFKRQIRCIDTNGKLLIDKADEIIGNLDTLTISIFENDPEADEQFAILKKFLHIKGTHLPRIIVRALGNVSTLRYEALGLMIAKRVLHSPMGSFNYTKIPTIPEIGICLDLLHHMVIKTNGDVSLCVRFDPYKHGVIGNVMTAPLIQIWESNQRQAIIRSHIEGNRDVNKLCASCQFWGVPRS